MHFFTPSSVRSARPRCGSSTGTEYCALVFSHPPPLRMSLTSTSSRSHCSKWMIGVPGPRLSPEFVPVIESTEFGRSLPRRVASATASRTCWRIQIWSAATGTLISKVGMPVSWQIAPSPSAARSMFSAMIVSACEERVPAGSACKRGLHRRANIRRQVRGCPDNQLKNAFKE